MSTTSKPFTVCDLCGHEQPRTEAVAEDSKPEWVLIGSSVHVCPACATRSFAEVVDGLSAAGVSPDLLRQTFLGSEPLFARTFG